MEIKKTINELFPGRAMPQLVMGIERAISSSLGKQTVNHLTRNVVRERFSICMNWAETLRGDLGWGTERVIGALPDILKTELSGKRYEPSKRTFWLPEDGT